MRSIFWTTRVAAHVVAFCAAASTVWAQGNAGWQPPLGTPMPPFGITDQASVTPPARPSPWNCDVPGFFYVDETHPGATDTPSSRYGCPATPRRTIPANLPAGSYVELNGTYSRAHTGSSAFRIAGTASAPVWIRGANPSSRPVVTRFWDVLDSQYFIFEHLNFRDATGSATDADTLVGRLFFYNNVSYGVLRHSEMSGNLSDGGLSFNVGEVHHVVVWNNYIHDNGNMNDTGDQDRHGITIGGRGNKSFVWVVDNELARNSGDGLQINGGTESLSGTGASMTSSLHHIYVGRNRSHNNKQTGMWTKQAQDVIFSENLVYSHEPSSSASGSCMGYQYGPHNVWFIANHLHDCDYGIQGQSDSGLGFAAPSVYIVGNVMHGIHWSDSFSSNAGVMFRSGAERVIVNNTFYDVDKGIDSQTASSGTLHVANNIFANVNAPGSANRWAILVGSDGLASGTTLHNNLFSGTFTVQLGSQSYSSATALNTSTERSGNISGADGLSGPTSENFHLAAGAPAIDRGMSHWVYERFQSLYGLSIAQDTDRTHRPFGGLWDIGADESGPSNSTSAPAPQPPQNLRIIR